MKYIPSIKQGLRIPKDKRMNIIKICVDADYLVKKGKLNGESAVENLIMQLLGA